MKTMKKLPFFVLALLFLMGCQAKPATDDTDSDVSIVEWEHSDIYTDADIQAAMDTVMTYFETEFKGCTFDSALLSRRCVSRPVHRMGRRM